MESKDIDKIYQIKKLIDKKFKSEEWDEVIGKKFDNLSFEEITKFRQNELSDGFDNSRLINLDTLNKKILDFKNILELFNLDFDKVNHLFMEKNIGENKNFINYKDKYIDYLQLNHIILYLLIQKYCLKKEEKNLNILEIGAGFGNLARMIVNEYNAKYFIIDLPEALILQAYYLTQFFTNKRICFPEDLPNLCLEEEHVKKYDIFLLPPSIKIQTNLKLNCAINSSSFMEIRKKDIKEYFKIIERNLKSEGFFFNNNRYFKDTSGEKIRLYEYPYDKKCKVIYSNQYLFFYRLHTLITKKIDVETNEIVEELSKIKKLAKNHEYPNFIPIKLMRIYQSIKKYLKLRFSKT